MVDKRFDNRSKDDFKKHIKFTTQVEKYFFNRWLEVCKNNPDVDIDNWSDNGIENDGEYIATGTNTSGADYMVDMTYHGTYKNLPLEMKWVPTAGKFTLKVNDLKAYIKEEAAILFIYNAESCGTNLRTPKHHDLDKYTKLIESKQHQFKWGIMWPHNVKAVLEDFKDAGRVQKIPYMGHKPGIVIKQEEFNLWLIEEDWI